LRTNTSNDLCICWIFIYLDSLKLRVIEVVPHFFLSLISETAGRISVEFGMSVHVEIVERICNYCVRVCTYRTLRRAYTGPLLSFWRGGLSYSSLADSAEQGFY
jgi:hypothetical protein